MERPFRYGWTSCWLVKVLLPPHCVVCFSAVAISLLTNASECFVQHWCDMLPMISLLTNASECFAQGMWYPSSPSCTSSTEDFWLCLCRPKRSFLWKVLDVSCRRSFLLSTGYLDCPHSAASLEVRLTPICCIHTDASDPSSLSMYAPWLVKASEHLLVDCEACVVWLILKAVISEVGGWF